MKNDRDRSGRRHDFEQCEPDDPQIYGSWHARARGRRDRTPGQARPHRYRQCYGVAIARSLGKRQVLSHDWTCSTDQNCTVSPESPRRRMPHIVRTARGRGSSCGSRCFWYPRSASPSQPRRNSRRLLPSRSGSCGLSFTGSWIASPHASSARSPHQRVFQKDRQYSNRLCQNTSRVTKAASTSVATII